MSTRPFKVIYTMQGQKVGRVCSCGSPEGVVRTACVRLFDNFADHAAVYLDDDLFAQVLNDGRSIELLVE